VTTRIESPEARVLLAATRRALAVACDGVDASAVQPETPLAALVFDSLMAVNFVAALEALLGVDDLPFEQWLQEHSERTDALTVGSLVEWLGSLPQIGACAVTLLRAGAIGVASEER
jgi:acyl carrier protein